MNLFKFYLFKILRFLIYYVPNPILFSERDRRAAIIDRKNREFDDKLRKQAESDMDKFLASKNAQELEELVSTNCEPYPPGKIIVHTKKNYKKIPLGMNIETRETQR
jgi:hypothetical protein